jgi:hypothetical protein
MDIFTNPSSLREPTILPNRNIRADFSPHLKVGGIDFPLKLSQAAKLLGVDHFNWRQKITLPPLWKVEKVQQNGHRDPVTQPYDDPIVLGAEPAVYVITNSSGVEGKVAIPASVTLDSYPWYGNDD